MGPEKGTISEMRRKKKQNPNWFHLHRPRDTKAAALGGQGRTSPRGEAALTFRSASASRPPGRAAGAQGTSANREGLGGRGRLGPATPRHLAPARWRPGGGGAKSRVQQPGGTALPAPGQASPPCPWALLFLTFVTAQTSEPLRPSAQTPGFCLDIDTEFALILFASLQPQC